MVTKWKKRKPTPAQRLKRQMERESKELDKKMSKLDSLLLEQAIKSECNELEEEFVNSTLDAWGFKSP